jgi:predicted nucleic acid-binding Zn ribbon protein
MPKRKCVACGDEFPLKRRNQSVCSRQCRGELSALRVKIRRQRDRGVRRDGALPVANCAVCGAPFQKRQANYVLCGRTRCKRDRVRQKQKQWVRDLKENERRMKT